MIISLFKVPISKLDGIGKKNEELFKKLKISSIGSLITFYPLKYEDWTDIKKLKECDGSKSVSKVEVIENFSFVRARNGKRIYKVQCVDLNDYGSILNVVFFNNGIIAEMMKKGDQFLVMGDIKPKFDGSYEVMCPKIKNLKFKVQNFEPIYSQVKGLSSYKIRKYVSEALKLLPDVVKDTLPEEIIKKYDLASLDFTIRKIHFPDSKDDIKRAHYRLQFEELLTWILSVKKMKKEHNSKFLIRNFSLEFLKKLDFELTNSQKKVVGLCIKDMSSGKSMMRLLQGDVGSGKTVVAMILAYNTIKSGYQVAVMVPTEILASQHYETFTEIFDEKDVRLLTSSTSKEKRKKIISELKNGAPKIVIGTHSLISDEIKFDNLALVITDEQHKFGINQREKLALKGEYPHNLIMSATPIPRSLAMVLYGNMDFCTIDEMPTGRKKVQTFVVDTSMRERVFKFIEKHLKNGHQAYIVCAKVKETENDNVSAVECYEKNVLKNFFKSYRTSTIHGKMNPIEKGKIMREFSEGKIDLLISTTVIETGINVPNATIILVENAEKFGMATLHQIRGRVGRGKIQSYCILMCNNASSETKERINALSKSNSGLMLAAKDMILRGPGQLSNDKKRQYGFESSRIEMALMDQEMVTRCISATELM